MSKGWTDESMRHQMSAYGIKTGTKNYSDKMISGKYNPLYDPLHDIHEDEEKKALQKKKALSDVEELANDRNLSSNTALDKIYSIAKKYDQDESALNKYYSDRVSAMDKNERDFKEKQSKKDDYENPSLKEDNRDGGW